MIILDGKKLAEKILANLKTRRKELKLAVILVGEDSSSQIFIKQKEKACEKVGIDFELFKFPTEIGSLLLKEEIKKIVDDPANSGVIIQLPLPKKFNAEEFLNLIPPEKDVDVLSKKSFKKFARGESLIFPPTVGAISNLFKKYGIKVKGKNIMVIGAGRLVGKPLVAWLKLQKAEFSVLDDSVKNISSYTNKADILISGAGKPNLIKGDMVKDGVVVVDFANDVDFRSVSKKASYITPVPGGIGPVTVACLLENLVKLNRVKF